MKEFFLVFRILYVTILSSQSDLTYSIKHKYLSYTVFEK